jgi:hypothetical protein
LKPGSQRRSVLVLLAIALLLIGFALAMGAAEARASDGGMAGMPGMTDEEMQNLTPPTAATPAASGGSMSESGSMSGSGLMQSGQAMDPGMDMGGGSINWFVIGGFIVLVVGSTIGAMATKRHLARRMAAGELAGAGALDV